MLDIKLIRDNPHKVDELLARRGGVPVALSIVTLDEQRRTLQATIQDYQQKRNILSKEIGIAKQEGKDCTSLTAQVTQIKNELPPLEEQEQIIASQLADLMQSTPNLPLEDVPTGLDENSNMCVRTHGTPPVFTFTPRSHDELGEALGLMNFERAAEISGARFVVLSGLLARLERALASFMLDIHTQEFGYTEVSPPLLVRDKTMFGTAQLPKFAEDSFRTVDGYWLISTSEISLTNLVANRLLEAEELPLRYTAYTPCFRREAGAAGKDTRGMIRQHQFNKVELVSIVHPSQGQAEHERMVTAAETVLQRLGLSYRVMLLCTGDMSFSARKTYDLEVWVPSQNKYREISSCSLCGDFQARRMNGRFRLSEEEALSNDSKTGFVYTLNGSGLAVGRTLVALLENYQQEDGSILIPSILRPYLNHIERISL